MKATKYNKRAGKVTPVIRIGKTKAGKQVSLKRVKGDLLYNIEPIYGWSPVLSARWYAVRNWLYHMAGVKHAVSSN
jgi:hypothetical protein